MASLPRSECVLDRLPVAVIALVMAQLDLPSRLRCRCVSWSWRRTRSDPELWRRIVCTVSRGPGDYLLLPKAHLLSASSCSTHLEELALHEPPSTFAGRVSPDDALAWEEPCPDAPQLCSALSVLHSTLRSLRLPGTLSVKHIQELIRIAPRLEVLECSVACSLREALTHRRTPLRPLRLVRLALTLPPNVTDAALLPLLSSLSALPTLRELSLSRETARSFDVPSLTPAALNTIGCGLPSLTSLRLNCGLEGCGLALGALVRSLTSLSTLCIDNSGLQGDAVTPFAAAVASSTSLEVLVLRGGFDFQNEDDTLWLPAVRACASLRHFSQPWMALAAAWVVDNRSPGPQPHPGAFLGPCHPMLVETHASTPDETECWLVHCSAPGCRETVCTRHGVGRGFVDEEDDDEVVFPRFGCVAEGCVRQFCVAHARAELQDCEVCKLVNNAEMGGLTYEGEHGRCRAHAPVSFEFVEYSEDSESDGGDEEGEEEEDLEASEEREPKRVLCCPTCLDLMRRGTLSADDLAQYAAF